MTRTTVDILLVEDDPTARELTLRALRRLDASLTTQVVVNGREALEYLTSRGAFADQARLPKPRLILMDLHVPNLNGLEVLQFLREDAHCADTPIVLLTSSENPKDVQAAYANGVNAYVVKPDAAKDYMDTVIHIARFWLIVSPGTATDADDRDADAG
jgi:CheY-like chemotaxis protein